MKHPDLSDGLVTVATESKLNQETLLSVFMLHLTQTLNSFKSGIKTVLFVAAFH